MAAGAPEGAGPRGACRVVQLTGTVFFDIVFSGLSSPPRRGAEIRTTGFGWSPGGVANLAVALRRLGLGVRLDAAFANDLYGDYLWRALGEVERIDLGGSERVDGWRTPLTVSMAYEADRSMVTYEEPQARPLLGFLDRGPSCALFAYLGADEMAWLPGVAAAGTRLFGDVGWDAAERWDPDSLAALPLLEAFMPNADEAMAYTRTSTPDDAARSLARLTRTAVVKCSRSGAVACTDPDGEVVHEPAIAVEALDPTGAGDVFDAAFVFGSLEGWGIRERLRFANVCAGISVQRYGGSLSAPTWGEIGAWLSTQEARDAAGDPGGGDVLERSPREADPWAFVRPYLADDLGTTD